jgi:hypothetical protein
MAWDRAAEIYGLLARLPESQLTVHELRKRVAKVEDRSPPADDDNVGGSAASRSAQDLAREYAAVGGINQRWPRLAILCGVLSRCHAAGSSTRRDLEDGVVGLLAAPQRESLYHRLDEVFPGTAYLGVAITPTSGNRATPDQRGSEIYDVRFFRGGEAYEPDSPVRKPLTLRQIADEAYKRAWSMHESDETAGAGIPILELFVERPLLGPRLRELCAGPAGDGPLVDADLPVVVRDLERITGTPQRRGWRWYWTQKWEALMAPKPDTPHGIALSCCRPGADAVDHDRDSLGEDGHFALVLAREPRQEDDTMTGAVFRALKGGYPLIVWPYDDVPCDARESGGACLDLTSRIWELVKAGPVDAAELARTLKKVTTWGVSGKRRVVAVLDDPNRRLLPDALTPPEAEKTPDAGDRAGIRGNS